MIRLAWIAALTAACQLLSSSGAMAQSSITACSATSKCPSSAPCCNGGQCGSGALHCAGGCQPLWSQSPSSCQPNPICRNKNLTFTPSDYNNSALFDPM